MTKFLTLSEIENCVFNKIDISSDTFKLYESLLTQPFEEYRRILTAICLEEATIEDFNDILFKEEKQINPAAIGKHVSVAKQEASNINFIPTKDFIKSSTLAKSFATDNRFTKLEETSNRSEDRYKLKNVLETKFGITAVDTDRIILNGNTTVIKTSFLRTKQLEGKKKRLEDDIRAAKEQYILTGQERYFTLIKTYERELYNIINEQESLNQ